MHVVDRVCRCHVSETVIDFSYQSPTIGSSHAEVPIIGQRSVPACPASRLLVMVAGLESRGGIEADNIAKSKKSRAGLRYTNIRAIP